MVDDAATDLIVDGGANVKTTLDGWGFFVADGGEVFQSVVSDGTTQSIDTDIAAYATSTDYQLRISGWRETSGIKLRFYIDGILKKSIDDLATSGQDPMHLIASLKGGSANDQVLTVNRIYYKQWRG